MKTFLNDDDFCTIIYTNGKRAVGKSAAGNKIVSVHIKIVVSEQKKDDCGDF